MNVTIQTKFLLLLVAACVCGACHYGPTFSSYPPARNPHGAEAEIITTSKGSITAEIIEVRDSDVMILSDGKLELRPYASIKSLTIGGLKRSFNIGGRPLSSKTRDELRLFSRFPQGLTPELLSRLLQANGQTELARAQP